MNKWKRKKLSKLELLFQKIFKKVFGDVRDVLDVKMSKERKRRFIKRYQKYSIYNSFCKKFANEMTNLGMLDNKKVWKQYYEQVKEKHTIALKPYYQWEKDIKKELFEENFKTIKSIPEKILKLNQLKYIEILQKQVITGEVGRKELEKFLEKINKKYAKIIARTEITKLQTSIIRERASRLGSHYYIWLSANDHRTRNSHRMMNNVVVEWSSIEENKPYLDKMYGHAGEFINCRCYPKPVFDDFDIPKNGIIKIWDIEKKKIIKKSRKEIVEML